MMTGNLPRSLTFGVLLLGFGSAVTAAPIAFNGSAELTSNTQTDLMRIEPQGRFLYSYSSAEQQIEALEIIEESGQLAVPASGNVLNDTAEDAFTSVADMEFTGSGRYLFVVNTDPANNVDDNGNNTGLHVFKRGAGSETVNFPVSLNRATTTGDCVGGDLTATHEVHTVEYISQQSGNYLYMGTVNGGVGEIVLCEVKFSPASGEDVEINQVASYLSADLNNVNLDQPRDLLRIDADLYLLNGGADSNLIHAVIGSNNGALTYQTHISNGPAVEEALCEPRNFAYSPRDPNTFWVSAASAPGGCAGGENANAVAIFKRNSIGGPQYQSFGADSNDDEILLGDLTQVTVSTDVDSPLYAVSRGEDAINYIRYNDDEEILENVSSLQQGDLTPDGGSVTGLENATQVAIPSNNQGFIYVGGETAVVGSFARISELDLTVRRSNYRTEPGRGIRFTAIVTNNGPADARDVNLEVFYPNSFVRTLDPQIEGEAQGIECEYRASSFKCNLFGLEVSDTRRVSYTLKPERLGEFESGLIATSSNRIAYDETEVRHVEEIKVGSFNNGGAIAMSPWVLLLALPLLWRRRDD